MSKGTKAWFKWPNGQVQRVYLYREFYVNGEKRYRGSFGKKHFVLKETDLGKLWSYNKEELL